MVDDVELHDGSCGADIGITVERSDRPVDVTHAELERLARGDIVSASGFHEF